MDLDLVQQGCGKALSLNRFLAASELAQSFSRRIKAKR